MLGELNSSNLEPSLTHKFYPINRFLTDRAKFEDGAEIDMRGKGEI